MTTPSWARARIGWVVDVQNDFMRPDGRLYVHNLFDPADAGATLAMASIVQTVEWMRRSCDVVVFTGDWHAYGDREIDTVAPDATKGTYPPHCMGLSPDAAERAGAALITEIDPGSAALVLVRDASDEAARDIARRAVSERRAVFVQKSEFSVFEGNRSADAFVQALREALGAALGDSMGDGSGEPVDFVLCGVATDVCVKKAVDGLLDRAARVHVVTDAIWSLGLLGPADTTELWAQRGARLGVSADLP
ncbi:MAG: isochorismatase family protein [Gemmatimonadaceae bacterium]|nr:isochorismatase family protein [Gemmatimonadaceae bacterium]